MKEIEIFQQGDHPSIRLFDDDDSNLSEFTKRLSDALEVDKVISLETTSGNVILRPSKISFIKVTEIIDEKEVEIDLPKEEINEITDEHEDIIMDGD